jgi:hypothetical protein
MRRPRARRPHSTLPLKPPIPGTRTTQTGIAARGNALCTARDQRCRKRSRRAARADTGDNGLDP